ncbi:MAG TPA: HAD family phosphatase [Ktedonobacterales bacterium]|nr:HAD family phosphatase [Ktedonobacterales bacterium]
MSTHAKNDAGVFSQNSPAQQALQAVIWDLDGVIVDSSQQHRRSWQLLAAETGVSFTDDDFWSSFGRSNAAIIPLHWGAQLTPAQVDDLANRKEVYFRDILRKEGLKALPGALELMQEARAAGIKQSLASSTPVENIKVVSELLGLERWLDAFVSGDRLPRGKPAPDVFLLAAKTLGVEPERSVVIEDAPAGVAAAKAAGMRCLAVTTSHPAAALAAADRIVDSLASIHVEDLQALLR